jgi:hypothetical protein
MPKECPHQQIIALYHEVLPELPAVREWTGKRAEFLRARWREKPERQAPDWWRDFFGTVRRSDFLMGRTNGSRGPFRCSLEWLVTLGNFVKVIEGNFHDRGDAHGSTSFDQRGML